MANLNFNGIIRGGVIRNMQILGFGADPTPTPPGPTPLQVSTSVRLNPADTPNVSFIPTLTGNAQTLTFSAWIKRSLLSSQQMLFGANTDTNNHVFLEFQANDTIRIASNTAASTVIQLITTQVFRDPSQWYHLVLTFDLTNSTQADRVRLYINGARVTAFSTSTLPANTTTFTTFNTSGVQQYIGRYVASSSFYFGGYIADINLVDGQALTPAAFTETDSATGQLIPMTYSGSYGVNGFYLPFGNSATVAELGLDPKATGQDYPYWPYTTLLVNSIGTNGAQNNTFLDSSTNAFSITRNGNTTQGNFTPFNYGGGTAQTEGYYSGYFDGTGDYVSVPSSAQLNLTGDFTIEMFLLMANATSGATQGLIANGAGSFSGTATALVFGHSSNPTKLSFFVYNILTSGPILVSSTALVSGQWYHVAIARSGSTIRLFVNGQQEATYSSSSTISLDATLTKLGAYWNGDLNGYISNARVVKGTAVYTANFTVPITPLTAIANTSLLTCQNSQFIDNSTNAFTINTVGNSRPVPTNPFGMTDWSGAFDGTDYLTIANNAALDPNTDSFCIECWVYITTTGATQGFGAKGTVDIDGYVFYVNSSLSLRFEWIDAGARGIIGGTLAANSWNHVAVVRNSGVIRLYLNGVGAASSTACTTDINSDNNLDIGRTRTGSPISGYISNYRMTKGALPSGYDATISTLPVPTAPLTAISGTVLLTCQSSTFIDNSTNAFPIGVNGNAYTLTFANPFNNSPINYTTPPVQAWSTYFDGASQLQVSTTNAAFDITGDFTVEGWFNVSGGYQFFGIEQAASPEYAAIQLQLDGSSRLLMLFSTSGSSWALQVTATPTYAFNQWNHLAITRSGSTIRLFQNGSVMASGTLSGALYSSGVRTCINGRNASGYITGSYSNFRFINGQALYTSNFTPSTEPLTLTSQGAQASQVKLLTCQSNGFIDNSIFNWPLTVGGTPQTQASSPFTPTTAYSAASYGGTMYLDGTGDSLSIPGNSAFDFGTGNFTAEAWVYPQGAASEMSIIDFWIGGGGSYTTGQWQLAYYNSNTLTFVWASNASTAVRITSASNTVRRNTWTHVAVTRTGNLFQIFTNGVLGASTTLTQVMGVTSSGRIGIQTVNSASPFTGYISGVRILKGTSLYPTAFVPPVAPPTAIANTSLLLNATNAGIYDASGDNDIETAGNAQVSTAVKKWGESSVAFDGTGDYLVIPSTNAPTQFGSQDFTIEAWVYSTSIGNQQIIISNRIAASGNTNYDWQILTSKLVFSTTSTNICVGVITLSSNTWYHVAVSRVSGTTRQFVNGVLDVTSTTSYNLTSNSSTVIGGNGTYQPTTYPFVGYIQDLRVTKGAGRYQGAFTPPAAAFAYNQYDICNQQWTPTNISVTAGTGQDNLADSPSDYGTDTGLGGEVRGNYATMSPIDTVGGTFANANLDVGVTSAAGRYIRATIAPTSGKWYWEATVLSTTGIPSVGVAATTAVPSGGLPVIGVTYSSNAVVLKDSTNLGTQTAWSVNNVVGIAYDADNLTIALYLNNALQTTVNLTTGYTYAPLFMSYSNATATSAVAFNFGQRAFAYAAPTGFKCLVSTNLPTPTIGATSSTQASDYFDVALWTGADTATGRSISGLQFAPDLWWSKIRSAAYSHQLYDSVRGGGSVKSLASNDTAAAGAGNSATYGYLSSFDPTGVTFTRGSAGSGTNPDGYAYYDQLSATYVAWAWRANGAGVANTAGTISSTVSANTTSGCSIVTYTGTGANATVGHGLGVAPSMVIVKQTSGTNGWAVYHVRLTSASYYLSLNTTDAQQLAATVWNGTAPTSSVFSIGTAVGVNTSSQTYVAYCFAPISGFSAMGSYTGNGSADGPMIFTNFRPAYVLYKRTDTAGYSWAIWDTARNTSNVIDKYLWADSAQAEATFGALDIVSNGFKLRTSDVGNNASGGTYIYMAFAAYPFKYSRAF